MSLLVCLINIFVCILFIPTPAFALTSSQVYDKVKHSVFVVKTFDIKGNLKSQGSAVLISHNSVATNCHVVQGGISYLVGKGTKYVDANLYAEDVDKDICLLTVKGINGRPAQIGKAGNLKVGDPVYAVGAPQGLELSLSNGIVSQLRGGRPPLIQTTASISPGSSGGGLFDKEGRLVGLTTLYVEGGQNLNFAMPAEWIGEVKRGRSPNSKMGNQTAWTKRSISLEESENWKELLGWCQQWTLAEPKNSDAWFSLGNAYYELKLFDDAIDAYNYAVRVDPLNFNAWFNLGVLYEKLKRYDDALEVYHKALRIDPRHPDALSRVGRVYLTIRRFDDAIKSSLSAVRVNPRKVLAWYCLGSAYLFLGRFEESVEALRQTLKIDPKTPGLWFALGLAYQKLKRFDEAVYAYRKVLLEDPRDVDSWFNLGVSNYMLGHRTAAMEAVRELQSLDRKKADILFDLIVPN